MQTTGDNSKEEKMDDWEILSVENNLIEKLEVK